MPWEQTLKKEHQTCIMVLTTVTYLLKLTFSLLRDRETEQTNTITYQILDCNNKYYNEYLTLGAVSHGNIGKAVTKLQALTSQNTSLRQVKNLYTTTRKAGGYPLPRKRCFSYVSCIQVRPTDCSIVRLIAIWQTSLKNCWQMTF